MQSTKTRKSTENSKNTNETVEILYQKLGSRWFAFSLIDDDVFVGSIDDEQLKAPAVKTPLFKVPRRDS